MSESFSRRAFLGIAVTSFAAVGCGTDVPTHVEVALARPSTPAEALRILLDGNARYAAGTPDRPDQTTARRVSLAQAQQPIAAVLGCADSRVAPELLFDVGIGDLFTNRVAGNLADEHTIGSIEYAVAVLGVQLVVVLGHERCGAVREAVDRAAGGATAPGHIESLVDAIRPAVDEIRGQGGDEIDNAVRANIRRVVAELAASGPILARATIVGARYDLDEGRVEIVT